jgi:hypothetical protein
MPEDHSSIGNGTGSPAGIGTPTRTRTHAGMLPVIPRVGAQRVCCAGWVERVSIDGSETIYLTCYENIPNSPMCIYESFERSSNLSSSILPCISSNEATEVTSSSLTNPLRLHEPRQRSARVNVTESRLRVCDRIRRPRLKSRSTSTDVAVQQSKIRMNKKRILVYTWYCQIVEGHSRQLWIGVFVLAPPLDRVGRLYRFTVEI